jgi:hypothetical protein
MFYMFHLWFASGNPSSIMLLKNCHIHQYVKKRVVLSDVVLLRRCLALCPWHMKTA